MAAAPRPDQDRPESKTTTLGDVLYANRAKTPVSEKDWVRLVQSIARGDQLALHALYEQTHRLVFTFTVRITGNRATAEEVTLDVFHDVWRRASAYDPAGGSVVGWIMNQARSRAIDRLRFEGRKKRVNQYPDDASTATAAKDPQEACQIEGKGRLLWKAAGGLSPGGREAIGNAFRHTTAFSPGWH